MKSILVGAGAHAVSVIDVLESIGHYDIAGVFENRLLPGVEFCGYPILGSFENLETHAGPGVGALVSVGQIGGPGIRAELFNCLVESGAELLVPISPHAYVSPRASLGIGTAVLHGAVVNANATVGSNCIINSLSLVEHGASIGNHCHIATGAIINGDASVGDRCFVGSGAVIFQGCKIPNDSIVPAGSTVRTWPIID